MNERLKINPATVNMGAWKAFLGFYLLSFIALQLIIYIAKQNFTSYDLAHLNRIHGVLNYEYILILGSIFIWNRIRSMFYGTSGGGPAKSAQLPQHRKNFEDLNKNQTKISPKMKIIVRISLIFTAFVLFSTHIAYVTFYGPFLTTEPNFFSMTVFIFMGIYSYLLFFLIGFSFLNFLCRILNNFKPTQAIFGRFFQNPFLNSFLLNSQRQTLISIGATVFFVIFGLYVAAQIPKPREVEIRLKNLPKEFENFKIALLSDIHAGPTVGRRRIEEIVQVVNELNVDLVAIDGDLVDGPVEKLGFVVEPLRNLKSTKGTFFVTGSKFVFHFLFISFFDSFFLDFLI